MKKLIASKKEVLVDDDVYEWAKDINWCLSGGRYAMNKKYGYLHRVVANTPKGWVTDHKDLNTLNCQRSNLRIASRNSFNMANTIKISKSRPFKGVFKYYRRWAASIGVNGKNVHLGYFSTPEEAHQAYSVAAHKHYGEFARP